MKKSLMICCLIITFAISACSMENSTTIVPKETDVHEEVEDNALNTDSRHEEDSVETDQTESEEDSNELNKMDVDLREKLITEGKLKDDEIRLFHQEDFDNDGIDEAFALTGEETEGYDESQKLVEGSVWFVNPNECRKILESEGMGFDATDRSFSLGNTKYELFDDVYATGRLTYAWYVAEGELKDAPISKVGTVITDIDGEDHFRILDSSYDAMYDPEVGGMLGHTWKQYYFFYDENSDRICEYGGTDIESSKAEYLCGMDIVGELLPDGDTLKELFYRGNGLVVMNYEHEEDGYTYNYHYIYDSINQKFIDDNGEDTGTEALEGIYTKALCPDIAVYPEDIEGTGLDFEGIIEDNTGDLPSDILSEIGGRYEDGYGDIVELSHPNHMIRFIKGGKQDHIYDEIICGYKVLNNAYLIKIEWDDEKYVYLYRKEGDFEYLYLLTEDGWNPKSGTYSNKTLQTYIKNR